GEPGLQPAAQGRLRDQDRVRPQRRVPGHRPREPPGKVPGECFEAIAAYEVEAGGIGHAGMMPERGRILRYEEVQWLVRLLARSTVAGAMSCRPSPCESRGGWEGVASDP